MLKIEYTSQFKKDYKLALKRGCNQEEFKKVISILSNNVKLPSRYRDHKLQNTNHYKNVRECHINDDWLLVYQIVKDNVVLKLIRTGTHSDLF